ncbi:hypothetical protein HA46_18395 [Pantoea septica]|uniref:Transposase n=3 Tax=Erwiniaceae TaxID=1903409 RepID=A0ABX3UMP5_9GAMM|nr:hypothetical protein HA46_18395 [Pantoea septica]
MDAALVRWQHSILWLLLKFSISIIYGVGNFMARTKAKLTRTELDAQIDRLECYLHETGVIFRSLTDKKVAEASELLHFRRLSEARREYDQLRIELELACAEKTRRFGKKTARSFWRTQLVWPVLKSICLTAVYRMKLLSAECKKTSGKPFR